MKSPGPSFFPLQHNTFTALIAEYLTVFQPHLSCHSIQHDITHHNWYTLTRKREASTAFSVE